MKLGIHPADEAQIETQFVNRFVVRMGDMHARIVMGEQVLPNSREIWTRALMMGREEALAMANAIIDADRKQRASKEVPMPMADALIPKVDGGERLAPVKFDP